MQFGIYRPGKFTPLNRDVEKQAKQLRRKFRLHGYWQSVLTVCWQNASRKKTLLNAITAATRHEKTSGIVRRFNLLRQEVTLANLSRYAQGLGAGEALFVSSKVRLENGRWRHLPMMDFSCYDQRQDLRKVAFALSTVGLDSGFILRSGNSFHYYGVEPLTTRNWSIFLGQCLLLVPITDARYIGHRIIDGACTLRLSSGLRKAKEPRLAAILGRPR